MVRGVQVAPKAIDFQVRDRYFPWETPSYVVFGGIVCMNLCMQHLEPPEDEDEDALCPPTRAVPLTHFLKESLHMETAVVVTYIPPQSHVASQRRLSLFDRVVKCNGKTIRGVEHLEEMVKEAAVGYNAVMKDAKGSTNGRTERKKSKAEFLVLETGDGDKIELSLDRLRLREAQDAARLYYPREKCHLFNGMMPVEVENLPEKKRQRVR